MSGARCAPLSALLAPRGNRYHARLDRERSSSASSGSRISRSLHGTLPVFVSASSLCVVSAFCSASVSASSPPLCPSHLCLASASRSSRTTQTLVRFLCDSKLVAGVFKWSLKRYFNINNIKLFWFKYGKSVYIFDSGILLFYYYMDFN